MDDAALHDERADSPRLAIAVAAVAVALIVADVVTGFALKGWGVVAGPLLLIVAATVWSLGRYSAIRLTSARLVVGRSSYAPHDFDAEFGVSTADSLTESERAHVDSPMPIPRDATVELAGGGWGKPAGTGVVVLRLSGSGKKLAVASRHPDRLTSLLDEWLRAAAG